MRDTDGDRLPVTEAGRALYGFEPSAGMLRHVLAIEAEAALLARPVEPEPDVLAKITRAEQAVDDLCAGRLRWEMRVPAEPGHDPDLIISEALRAARALLARRAPLGVADLRQGAELALPELDRLRGVIADLEARRAPGDRGPLREALRDIADGRASDEDRAHWALSVSGVQGWNTWRAERARRALAADSPAPGDRDAEALPDNQTVEQFVRNLQACLRKFGAHRPHCSTVQVPGHKICDCGLTYAIAKYAPPNVLRALAADSRPEPDHLPPGHPDHSDLGLSPEQIAVAHSRPEQPAPLDVRTDLDKLAAWHYQAVVNAGDLSHLAGANGCAFCLPLSRISRALAADSRPEQEYRVLGWDDSRAADSRPEQPERGDRLRILWHPGEQVPFVPGRAYRCVAVNGHASGVVGEPDRWTADFVWDPDSRPEQPAPMTDIELALFGRPVRPEEPPE